jgi:hypothetical protein
VIFVKRERRRWGKVRLLLFAFAIFIRLVPEIVEDYYHTDEFKEGKVTEIETLDDYNGMINYHRDATGLPIIMDFYSNSCGESISKKKIP